MENKEQMVLEAMEKAGTPMRTGDVAKTTGLASDEVSKIIKSLKKKRKIISPKGAFTHRLNDNLSYVRAWPSIM